MIYELKQIDFEFLVADVDYSQPVGSRTRRRKIYIYVSWYPKKNNRWEGWFRVFNNGEGNFLYAFYITSDEYPSALNSMQLFKKYYKKYSS